MKIWGALFNMIGVLVLLFLCMTHFNTTKVLQRDFDEARLKIAVDYATEAMFAKALEVEDIDTDYSSLGNISVNPSDSLDIFESIMCLNYGMSPSVDNKMTIENYIPTAVLASDDGYYLLEEVQDDITPKDSNKGGDYTLRWSLKRPYFAKSTLDGRRYAISMSRPKWAGVSNSGDVTVSTEKRLPAGITEDDIIPAVNDSITAAMSYEIARKNWNSEAFEYKFYLPYETTRKGVNPITKPSVLLFLQGVDFASSENIDVISVSGFKAVARNTVVGFKDGNGNKYYCYNGQMTQAEIGTYFHVTDHFREIDDAAKAGYSPHHQLLTRKITK